MIRAVLHLSGISAVESPQPAQQPAYEVRLNPVYSISNLVAGFQSSRGFQADGQRCTFNLRSPKPASPHCARTGGDAGYVPDPHPWSGQILQ